MNNLTLFQFFHWYTHPQENLWQQVVQETTHLTELGVTHVWLPPAYKSAYGQEEPGYAVYDLFDLGEFDQKQTVRTRYGTKDEYLTAIKRLREAEIQVLADIVLNHKLGGDETEKVHVRRVNPENRSETIGEEVMIDAWTKFSFPGRMGRYSDYVWDWHSFTGFSENEHDIFLILNEHTQGKWGEMLDDEKGNYDYLMGADIEFRNPNVREELKKWAIWYIDTTGVDSFRLDAVKHISVHFYNEWLEFLRDHYKKDFFCIGEYWRSNRDILLRYAEATNYKIQLFDVPLHFNFQRASVADGGFDMRQIFDGTLIQVKPEIAISFVDNHDTQPLQSLQSPVESWFKPLAYALILLREQGLPSVFYPAFYGATYKGSANGQEITINLEQVNGLGTMLKARKELSYGSQHDYFDHANTIGWVREGVDDRPGSGIAVVLTNGSAGDKKMTIGKRHAGHVFIDTTGNRQEEITIDEDGVGTFTVNDRSVSVWARKENNARQ